MKQYIGTKIVQAAPAVRYLMKDGNNWVIEKDDHLALAQVNMEDVVAWEDAYVVVYKDGYSSWSPKAVFEEAYRETTGMLFGLAIEALKKGFRVARKGWNGKGIYLELQAPDEHSKMTLPYIYIVTSGLVTDNPHAPKGCVPWLASQTDMLADDWYIVE